MSAGKRLSAKPRAKRKTASIVLAVLGIFLLAFIVCMIVTFWVNGSVPDTLIDKVLDAGAWEAVALALIKISKVVTGRKNPGESERTYE